MPNKARVFISYKTGPDTGLTFQANIIREKLIEAGYDVWWDAENLQAGLDWNAQIYDAIPHRDVLVLLLAGETAKSDWVRREVDIAKGSRVAVLPVKIRADFELSETLKKFDITFTQSLSLLKGTDAEFEDLREGIDQLHESNCRKRRDFLDSLGDKPGTIHDPAQERLRHFRYEKTVTKTKTETKVETQIFLAAGNFLDMKGFDALVNAENDYMQMARIFEAKTISSLMRYHGSEFDAAGRIVEDTVQNELDAELKGLTRPVGKSTVIVTSAGHSKSRLQNKIGARHILHGVAVTVEGEGIKKHLEPIRDSWALKDTVRSVLDKATQITKHAPKSIYMPMFGAGRGGLSVDDVARPIVGGVKEYLVDEPKPLKEIYLGVLFKEDVNALEDALKKEFGEPIPAAGDDTASA